MSSTQPEIPAPVHEISIKTPGTDGYHATVHEFACVAAHVTVTNGGAPGLRLETATSLAADQQGGIVILFMLHALTEILAKNEDPRLQGVGEGLGASIMNLAAVLGLALREMPTVANEDTDPEVDEALRERLDREDEIDDGAEA